ncbi:hypothetical protein Tco_1416071 [Tanacetum coccineum]
MFENGHTAPEHVSPGLGHQLMTSRPISSGLVPQPPSPTPNVPPIKNDRDTLFCPMFDEYFNPSPSVAQPVLKISTEMWKIGFFCNFCSGAGIFSSAIVSVKEYQQR